ncbi:MAG: hypothetical protein WCJ56_02870 [bacterium]
MKQVKSVMILMVGLLVGFLTGALVTGGYSAGSRFNYEQPVCQVGNTVITRGQLAEATILQNGISVLETDMKYRAYVEESARINHVTITPEEVKQRVDEYKNLVAQFDQLSDILGSKSILDSIPQEMLNEETRFTMLAEKVMKVTLTEKDITDWYVANPKVFFRPKMVKLTLIKTSDYAKARSALNRLDRHDPADTAQIISAELSDDRAVQNAKGDMGWWSKESMLIPQFVNGIFNRNNGQGLKTGEYTSVIAYTDPTTHNNEYRIFYVEQVKEEWIPGPTEIKPALRFLARMDLIRAAQPKWLAAQQPLIPWMRVKNLRDPEAKVEIMPL